MSWPVTDPARCVPVSACSDCRGHHNVRRPPLTRVELPPVNWEAADCRAPETAMTVAADRSWCTAVSAARLSDGATGAAPAGATSASVVSEKLREYRRLADRRVFAGRQQY